MIVISLLNPCQQLYYTLSATLIVHRIFIIKYMRTTLSKNLTKSLINSLVPSRLNYSFYLMNLLPAKSTIALIKQIIRSATRTTYRVYVTGPYGYNTSSTWLPFSLISKLLSNNVVSP